MIYPYQPSGGGSSSPGVNARDFHPGDFTYWQHYFTNFPKNNNTAYFYHPFYASSGVDIDGSLTIGDEMGVLRLISTASYAALFTGYLFNNVNKNQLNTYARVRMPVAPNGTDDFAVYVGFSDAINNPVGAQCAVLMVDRSVSTTNWIIRTGTTGATTVDTGVAFSTNWTNVEVRKNEDGTSFTFYLDGVLVGTRTTNLPSGPVGVVVGSRQVAGSGGTNQCCFAGYSVKQATPWTWAAFST